MRGMSESLNTRTARWLLAFFVLLILYGSLFPFELRHVDVHGPLDAVRRVRWGISTRGDIFANVLLYLPFGAALAWSLPQAGNAFTRVLVAAACGALLSFSVELTQVFLVRRVATYADVVNNTIGAFLGAGLATLVRSTADRLHASEVFRLTREPVSAALVALWLATFLPSWLPPLDTSRWPQAWARLLAQDWPSWQAAGFETLGWIVAGAALRTLTRPNYVWPLLAFLVLGALAAQFTLFVGSAKLTEPLGALFGLAAWPVYARLPERTQVPLLFVLVAAALVWRGLEPFTFVAHPGGFNLVPFADLISRGSSGFDLPLFFGKAFWCGSLVWLLVRLGTSALAAGVVVAAGLLGVEILQMWTPAGHHRASITDPLVAISAGIVMALFSAGPSAAPAPAAKARKRRA
jgi:VanZ family protein